MVKINLIRITIVLIFALMISSMIPQIGNCNPDEDIGEIRNTINTSYLHPDPIVIDGIISTGE